MLLFYKRCWMRKIKIGCFVVRGLVRVNCVFYSSDEECDC